ncbi:MAG: holo-ACP synthase [Candidatus Kryptoniota bacterium]
MVEGIGVDIVEVSRIKQSIEKYGPAFMDKIFTEEEKSYCSSKPNPYQHYAARFAAKEAFSKATATGWNSEFSWQEVQVANEESGKPFLKLSGKAAENFGKRKMFLSLSHSGDYVVAMVLLEG